MHHNFLPRDFGGGLVNWRLRIIHLVAKALGVTVKVEGFPYGSARNWIIKNGMSQNPAELGVGQYVYAVPTRFSED